MEVNSYSPLVYLLPLVLFRKNSMILYALAYSQGSFKPLV